MKIIPYGLLSQVLLSLMSNLVGSFTEDTKYLSYIKGIGSLHAIMECFLR